MSFPLIYCNGCSYSNENYHPELKGNVFADFVAQPFNGFVVNKSINGSCNRRILRTSTHDLILQRQLNPDQDIIALISLTFDMRSEVWVDDVTADLPEETNFRTHNFSEQNNWRENLLNNKDIGTDNFFNLNKKFLKKYSEGRAFFYSPYAERINLYNDLIALKSLLELHNIKFLIFRSVLPRKVESEYLMDFFEKELNKDKRIIDIDNFGWLTWASEHFTPLDFIDNPTIGHYGKDAHKSFAESILLPLLEETKQI